MRPYRTFLRQSVSAGTFPSPASETTQSIPVGFCRDPETDPEREAKLDAEFTVSVLDIVKVTAIAASIAAGLAAVVRLIIAACRNDD